MRATEPYETQIIDWSNRKPTEELCGVLIKHRGTFTAMQITNVASDKETTFAMDEQPFLDAVNSGQVWGIWHVHPNPDDEDGPSIPDMDRANAWQMPGCVLVRRKMHFRYYLPDGMPTPLYGRPYVPGIFDCYAMVRDALKQYLDFELADLDREQLDMRGCLPDPDLLWTPSGWERLLQPKAGRVALIDFGGHGKCNHLGLIISRTEMLHQIRGQLSRVDFLGSWQRWSLGYLEHPQIAARMQKESWERLPVNPNEFSEQGVAFNRPIKASGSLVDASGKPTRVSITENPSKRLPVRHPLRDISPRRPVIYPRPRGKDQ
jgi:proteasome lid subunit RPN8/RPN11